MTHAYAPASAEIMIGEGRLGGACGTSAAPTGAAPAVPDTGAYIARAVRVLPATVAVVAAPPARAGVAGLVVFAPRDKEDMFLPLPLPLPPIARLLPLLISLLLTFPGDANSLEATLLLLLLLPALFTRPIGGPVICPNSLS